MFSKKAHGDVKKSSQKLLDSKKDAVTRLKHLRVVLDNLEQLEARSFFEQYYSHIFYVFYENFISVEANLKQRVHKAQREELDGIVAIFEKILLYVPDLVHARWQYQSIGRVLKKLLHVGNCLKIRMDGLRLFLLWFMALQENSTEEAYLIYATLIHGFPTPPSLQGSPLEYIMTHTIRPPVNSDYQVQEVEILPIIPCQPGDKVPDNLTRVMLEAVLHFSVSQLMKMHWKEQRRYEESFIFLLDNFRQYYLPHIFPGFSFDTSLYKPNLEIPSTRCTSSSLLSSTFGSYDPMLLCRVSVVQWVVSFITVKKADNSTISALQEEKQESLKDSLERKLDAALIKDGDPSTVSPSATLNNKEQNSLLGSGGGGGSGNAGGGVGVGLVPLALSPEEEELLEISRQIVQKVFYSSRGNINFVHEVLRQGFLLPMSEAGAVRKALRIYNDWIQAQLTAKPIFMEEPSPAVTVAVVPASSPQGTSEGVSEADSPSSPSYEQIRSFEDASAQPEQCQPLLPSPTTFRCQGSSTYLGAINEAIKEGLKNCNVKAGLQATIQVFITNSANVFLLEPVPNSQQQAIKDQVEICKRVLKLYRHVVMNVTMETRTWEQLLMVLLRVTEGVLGGAPSRSRLSLGQQLAQILFQTLIVSWIKANLKIRVSKDLWDRFLNVLSSLTHWAELITEWSKTMETLTRVLSKRVYSMDLNNLPLENLSDNRNKRLRGPRGGAGSVAGGVAATAAAPHQADGRDGRKHDRTFSRGWSRCDSSSPMGSDEADGGKHRERISTVGSRDDLERLRHKMPYMREVGSKEDATNVLANLKNVPLSTSTSHPTLQYQQSLQIRSMDDALGSLTRSSSEGKLSDAPHRYQVSRQSSEPDSEQVRQSGLRDSLMEKAGSLPEEYDVMEVKSMTDENDVLEFKTLSEDKVSLEDKISLEGKSPKSEGAEPKTPSEDTSSEDKISLEEKMSKHDEYRYEKMGEYQLAFVQTDTVSIDSSEIATPDTAHTILDNNRLTPTSLTDLIASDVITPSPVSPSLSSTPSPGMTVNGVKGSPIYEPIRLEEQDKLDEAMFETAECVQSPDASVMSGGTRPGWQSDVAFVLWRRILGALGDVNDIQIARLHAVVMECLWNTWQLLTKIRDNLGVSSDNQNTPPPPEYIPPLGILSPWLFKAVHLSERYQQGRLSAYKLLCAMTTRKQDHPLPREHLTHFYRMLHYGLVGMDHEVINTIIQYSAPDFFSCGLPGSTLLILDYIQAANMIASRHNLDAPRIEALSLLGSLVCFPNLFCNITVLQPSPKDINTMQCKDVKDHLIKALLKCSRKEPVCEARCVALCSLGIFLYEEMAHVTFHPRTREAISVLLATLKFNNRIVAQVACDMLLLLADQAEMLRRHNNEAPKKIIEVIAMTINSLLSNAEFAENEDNKKLVVSMLFCLLEWCMAVPLTALLEVSEGRTKKDAKILLETVFKVLQNASEGVSTNQRTSVNFSELASSDYDPHINLDVVRDGPSFGGRSPSQHEALDQVFEDAHADITEALSLDGMLLPEKGWKNLRNQEKPEMHAVQFSVPSSKVVRLAAKTVMCHLVNHVNHFPLGGGPALVTSLVNELDDLSFNGDPDATSAALFNASNVQFFIFNDSSLISFVQLSDKEPSPDLSSSLTTAASHARIVVRNVGGKFVWDTSVLYGPEESRERKPPALTEPQRRPSVNNNVFAYASSAKSKSPVFRILNKSVARLPSWIDVDDSLDVLDELQQFIGFTSPECLLNPGVPLNLVSPPPEEIPAELESSAVASLKKQSSSEEAYVHQHGEEYSMVTEPLIQTPHQEPTSPFHMCRQLLDQLGVMTWDRRAQVNVVKKNDRLLRELKNLDSRQCRETHKIAVLYVAEGQEDKMSVLGNDRGSQAFENFIAGLAWEVDLSTHQGFLGGLQRNRSTGETAPYYATSTVEVIYHVSTRMPSENNLLHKMRHLGNDEVHIVWSEHTRDYRRGIIATEFGDVIIVIYPLENQLFRIQIQRKREVPFFGPLFDGAIVDHKVLPGLVRATAINASRIKRLQLPLYQRYYEERAKYLETIIKNHKESSTFETFSAHVFDPLLAKQLNGGGASNKSRSDNAPPTLTSAILDAQIQAHHSRAGTVRHAQDRAPAGASSGGGAAPGATPGATAGLAAGGAQGPQGPGPTTGGGGGGSIQRPTRLLHQEKLVNVAAGSGQLPRPVSGSMDEKVNLDPNSAGSTPVDPTAATVPQLKMRPRTKRASSSGSMTSESTPPESPADSKKK